MKLPHTIGLWLTWDPQRKIWIIEGEATGPYQGRRTQVRYADTHVELVERDLDRLVDVLRDEIESRLF